MTKIANFDPDHSQQLSSGITTGSGAGGDLSGSYPSPTVPHITVATDAHDASAISIVDTGGYFTGTQVEAALQELGAGSTGSFVTKTGGGSETRQAHGAMGATETLDLANGNWHTGTLDANCAITVSGFTAGEGDSALVGLSQDGTGGWAVTWDADVDFGGLDDQPDQTASSITWFVLWTDAGDGTIYGAKVGGAGVSGGTPALTFSTTNAAGVAATAVLTDATIALFDATVPVTQAFGDAAAAGSAGVAARRDHRHGMPATPAGVGAILITDTPAGSPLIFADLLQNDAGTDLLYADI